MGLKFSEYDAPIVDEDGDDTGDVSTVRACVLTEKTEINTRTGAQVVPKGSVVIETDRPGTYDVLTGDQWKATGYGAENVSAASSGATGRPRP